jgi:CheY-like chemotaxis protein
MDINMPVMDGLEATRQIRAHEIRNNLPKVTIIALTGVADSEIQQEANSSGINLFLIKPVRLADLEVILKGVITGQDNAKLELKLEQEGQKMAAAQVLQETVADPVKRLSTVVELGSTEAGAQQLASLLPTMSNKI